MSCANFRSASGRVVWALAKTELRSSMSVNWSGYGFFIADMRAFFHGGVVYATCPQAAFLGRFIVFLRLPEDLAKNPESQFRIARSELQSVDEAANFLVGWGGGAPLLEATGIRFQVTAGAEALEQERGEALEVGGGGGGLFFRFRGGLRTAG